MPLQEQPRPCQLFEWIPCYTLVSQHLPCGVGFVCPLLHECMEQGLTRLGTEYTAHQCDMTCLSVAMVTALVAKNENNSILLSLMRRNSCQFPGIVLDGSMRRRIPFPLRVRVSAFKLSAIYSSHTTSSLFTCCSCDVMYGRNTWVA